MCEVLGDKFTFFSMGIGANGNDFTELKALSDTAKVYGGNGEFNHAGLSAANLGDGFSKIASSMSTVRSGLLSKSKDEVQKDDKTKLVIPLRKRQPFKKSVSVGEAWKAIDNVRRFKLKKEKRNIDQDDKDEVVYGVCEVSLINRKTAIGFAMEKVPFEKGTERFAYRFQEIDTKGKLVGNFLVAKETKGVREVSKKLKFYIQFCKVQSMASEFAKNFNRAIYKTRSLKPLERGGHAPPTISFVKCSMYQYNDNNDDSGQRLSILVETFLKGKFIKYNANNGYVNEKAENDSPTIDLTGGEAKLTDFIQAFSHWTYVYSHQKLLLCDLQGVLNQEGRSPKFGLTDPAFCSNKQKSLSSQCFGGTDIGLKGVRAFFRTHKCNMVCKCLGLPES